LGYQWDRLRLRFVAPAAKLQGWEARLRQGDLRAVAPLVTLAFDQRDLAPSISTLLLEGGPAVAAPLLRLVIKGKPGVDRVAARLLADYGDWLGLPGNTAAAELLLEALKEQRWLSGPIARALAHTGDPRAVKPVRYLLSLYQYSGGAEAEIFEALARMREREVIPFLVHRLSDLLDPRLLQALDLFGWQPTTVDDRVQLALARGDARAIVAEGAEGLAVLLGHIDIDQPEQPEMPYYSLPRKLEALFLLAPVVGHTLVMAEIARRPWLRRHIDFVERWASNPDWALSREAWAEAIKMNLPVPLSMFDADS